MNGRSMKSIAHNASAAGTSGSPNRFICQKEAAVDLEAEVLRTWLTVS